MEQNDRLGRYEERLWEPPPGAPGGRRNRRGFRYEVFVPVAIAEREFDFRGDVAAVLTDATTALSHLNSQPPQLHPLEALARQLLRAESLASSRIEGLELSHRRLARAAHEGPDSHDPTASEVVGNLAAMEAAIELGSQARPITLADVQEIHSTLLRFATERHVAGLIREKQNWIGKSQYNPHNADYVPPPPGLVQPLIEDLCAFIERDDLPALAQAAIAHAQFETIHPFWDGNGRVGRCLIHTVLRRRGLAPRFVPPISLILATRAQLYVGGLVDYREGRVDDWVEVFSLATQAAAARAEQLADEIAALQERWVQRAGRPRKDSAALGVIELLPAYPVIDVPTVVRVLGVSDVAAGGALNKLQAAGILTNLSGRKRGRTWECPELFDLVNAFERKLATPDGDYGPVRAAPRV